jgi:hypothetical protein
VTSETPGRALLEQHHAYVSADRPWQRRLRLRQALWREAQRLPIGVHRAGTGSRPLGSRLAMPSAQEEMSNYLSPTIRQVVRDELADEDAREQGKLFSTPRIYEDLLSSQPLCFNLFGELKADLAAASRWGSYLWPARVEQVTRLEFEYSPGRGEAAYLGNRTAFDVYLEHTVPGGGEGFIGIEVKYHEGLAVQPARNHNRITEVANRSGAFEPTATERLSSPPLQQVWFDHLLALSMLQFDTERWGDNGLFVFLHPVENAACYEVIGRYERCLRDARTFQRLTLEELVSSLHVTVGGAWVRVLDDRYLGRIEPQASHPAQITPQEDARAGSREPR